MISRLRGTLAYKKPPSLVLDVGGVGYEVEAPMSTFYKLPSQDANLTLFTHLAIREDAQTLYGFSTEQERTLFRELIKISGVGPKLALAILSGMSVEDFGQCVREDDAHALIRLPGVGKKMAQRLLIEMRDRIAKLDSCIPESRQTSEPSSGVPSSAEPIRDAIDALCALGYKTPEAARMVRQINSTDLSAEELIREALRSAVRPNSRPQSL